jgi:ubiquinone/menaquinone biosynthesis C-methylase UbiE
MRDRPGPRKQTYPSTYFVQESNEKELTRLTIQDQMITAAMGGVLPEQVDPTVFRRVLDVGCGVGGWIMEAAQTYPAMSLVGIDINQRIIKYARTQAEAHQVHDQVEFHIMDALGTLEFPPACFDLVNLRFGISFLRTWDWPKMLGELLRVTRPGGVVRITDSEVGQQSKSAALTHLFEMLQCALFQAGHFFMQESTGLTSQLVRLLTESGCQQVQTKAYAMEYRAGMPQGEMFYQDLKLLFQTSRPFIQKRGCAAEDYETIYRQALKDMRQPDFLVAGNMLTVWGYKP